MSRRATRFLSALSLLIVLQFASTGIEAATFVHTLATGLPYVRGIAVGSDGTIYVSQAAPANRISRITPTGAVTTIATGLSDAVNIAVDPAGNIYVVNFNGGTGFISKVALDGTQSLLTDFAGSCCKTVTSIVYMFAGYFVGGLAVGEYYRQFSYAVHLDGWDYQVFAVTDGSCGYGLSAVTTDDLGWYYEGFERNGCIYRTGLTWGSMQFASGLGCTRGMVWRPNDRCIYTGDILYASVMRVDPAGAVSVVAGRPLLGFKDGPGEDALFNYPMGVALSPDGNRLYVADYGNGAVREVDLDQPTPTQRTSWGRLKTLYR